LRKHFADFRAHVLDRKRLTITPLISASIPLARSRWSENPVISTTGNFGQSRETDSASAIPSITGMEISVSRRSASLPPCRYSSAAAPSATA
jgi:hypothetical protein